MNTVLEYTNLLYQCLEKQNAWTVGVMAYIPMNYIVTPMGSFGMKLNRIIFSGPPAITKIIIRL